MEQQMKPQLPVAAPVQVSAPLLLIHCPAGAPENTVDEGPNTWVSAAPVGDGDGVPYS